MKYSIIQKKLGVASTDLLLDIETDLEISDFCHIPSFGYLLLFASHHCIGYVDYEGKYKIPWMGKIGIGESRDGNRGIALLNSPSSICYFGTTNNCYVVEAGGQVVRRLELDSGYITSFLGRVALQRLSKYFIKSSVDLSKIKTAIDINNKGELYWVSHIVNRCFKFSSSNLIDFVGNGHCGYSVSSKITSCLLNAPSGLCCNKSDIFISDTGNHCLRKITNGILLIVRGDPNNTNVFSSPTKVKIKGNHCYVMDGNVVKHVSLSDNSISNAYEGDNLLSFDVDKKGNLFILGREL